MEVKGPSESTGLQQDSSTLGSNLHSKSLQNKVLSISTTSIKSLLPNFYSITGNYSTPTLGDYSQSFDDENNSTANNESFTNKTNNTITNVSDELARESDVTVSTNVTPQAEYKGFASYVISCFFIIIWICWSVLPDRALNKLGVYYYPSRWWALAIPSYILCLMMYTYIAIACYNSEYLTLPLNDNRNIVDDSGIIVTQLKNFKPCDIRKYVCNGTSGVWDLPISVVNEILYSQPDTAEHKIAGHRDL